MSAHPSPQDADDELPQPVGSSRSRPTASSTRQQAGPTTTTTTTTKKTATFLPQRTPMRVHWDHFKKVIGTASALSESLLDATVESTEASSFRAAIAARADPDWGTTTREGRENDEAEERDRDHLNLQNGLVDEVVVDTDWEASRWGGSMASESAAMVRSDPAAHHPGTNNGSCEPSRTAGGFYYDTRSQAGFTNMDSSRARDLFGLVTFLRWRLYPSIHKFFDLGFWNEAQEERYRKDTWYTSKQLAVWAALFYILNIILTGALVPQPFNILNKVTYYGVAPALNVPLLVAVLFNVPRHKFRISWPYQVLLVCATWSWAWFNIFDMWSCGFYLSTEHPLCGSKDFQLTSYFSTALPTIALFGLGQTRGFAALGAIAYSVLVCCTILPIRQSWVRNFLNVLAYQIFLIYIHYCRETAERRLFILRDQLKDQFKATQKAQVNERKESDSKKRFVSYIFHEVRVPLNTALLASQNLVGSHAVSKDDDIEFSALEGSLKMMSKVLNDVLDFNRMDSGRFVTVSKPYCFHNAIRSMLLPLALTARSRGLELTTSLDPRIDEAANRAAYAGAGDEYDANAHREGMVLGDEMRLRQLVTNLTSNACKFTSEGGKIHVETRLVYPAPPERGPLPVPLRTLSQQERSKGCTPRSGVDTPKGGVVSKDFEKLSPSGLEKLDGLHDLTAGHASVPLMPLPSGGSGSGMRRARRERESVVVRIEVRDTGVGIRPRDLVDNRLFSPYVQTEIGRYQGGKGTGLGLALVRHIVKLTGGRLGVRSRVGEGSTFWVELALGVGPEALLGGSVHEGYGDGLAWEAESTAPSQATTAMPRNVKSSFEREVDRTSNAFMMRGDMPAKARLSPSPTADQPVSSSTISDSSLRTVRQVEGEAPSTIRTGGLRPPDKPSGGLPSPAPSTAYLPHPLAMAHSKAAAPETAPAPTRPPLAVLPTQGDPARGEITDQKESASINPMTAVMRHAGAGGPTLTTGSLPAVPMAPQQEPPLPVLVVDDDPLTRKLMARMLTRIGCTVDLAENGQVALDMLVGPGAYAEAVARYGPPSSSNLPTPATDVSEPVLVDEHKFAVVFLDNQMPMYTGVQVASRLRELERETFVVGVTGNALKEDQQEYLDAGIDRILTKPVLEKDLRSMVTVADEARRRRLAARTQPQPHPTS